MSALLVDAKLSGTSPSEIFFQVFLHRLDRLDMLGTDNRLEDSHIHRHRRPWRCLRLAHRLRHSFQLSRQSILVHLQHAKVPRPDLHDCLQEQELHQEAGLELASRFAFSRPPEQFISLSIHSHRRRFARQSDAFPQQLDQHQQLHLLEGLLLHQKIVNDQQISSDKLTSPDVDINKCYLNVMTP
jgi:hypothetical protein